MSTNTDWDVEKHKLEHECDEHWELRKAFLEAHKDRFPEEQLVCLAQVFTNVELLGCRYPKETMELIAELSEDIAKDYRDKQKLKLQRTFVKASDAASARAKGHSKASSHCGIEKSMNIRNYEDNLLNTSNKRQRTDKNQPFGNLVLLEYPNSTPQSTIETSVRISGQKIEWKYNTIDSNKECTIFINDKKLSDAIGNTKKSSKAEAAKKAIIELRKYYYLIHVKEDWKSKLNGKSTQLNEINDQNEKSIQDDNVGAKLMKLMGWAGGGLGRTQQGITEPVTLQRQISRRGFGMKLDSNNMNQFKRKCHETLSQYLRDGDAQDPLVFTDFDTEERVVMHECARKMGLKSQSHGAKNKRTLIVSRRIEPNDLVTELLKVGGTTDKYILKLPENDSIN